MPSVSRVGGATAVCLVFALSACGIRGLNFTQDTRLTITTPVDRSVVELPVTIEWEVRDFTITGQDGRALPDAGYFGITLDRAPQPPQRTQESLVEDLAACERDPTCPNPGFLAQNDIYSTTETSISIARIADPTPRDDRRELHEVTIVLLNGRGERIGESAFTVEFEIDRDP